ncbi:hypothetical protein [Methanosalsum natronophilum]|uniref:hypothetical protein n=1 Tax=Methanosalsum natronophilum TaxID=768733 RepID=UPI00216A3DC2|nr:hypothetical protein [Methanosalsum natronophilum]MCS3924104.1 hypothetical protein [Methanosalsum natronophilum]
MIPSNTSDPYLHELFKAAILYDCHKVFGEFLVAYPTTALKKYTIVESRQEYDLKSHIGRALYFAKRNNDFINHKICDVVWVLEKKSFDSENTIQPPIQKRIIHEVKTGKANVFEIYKQYKGLKYGLSNTITGMDPLWIWGWRTKLDFTIPVNELDTDLAKSFESAKKQKRLRILNLNLIKPLLDEKLLKITGR